MRSSRTDRRWCPGRRRALVALGLAATTVLTGCTGDEPDPAETAEVGQTTTPPMLAAAVAGHTAQRVVAAAALPDDGSQEDIGEGDIAVEVALDRPVGDHAHIRVVLTRGGPFAEDERSLRGQCREYGPCEDVGSETVPGWLMFEDGAFESDPGRVYGWSVRDDVTVWAWAYGPFVDGEPDARSPELQALADTVVAVVTDPEIGATSSAAYVEGGAEICHGPWVGWYGQGVGDPRPGNVPDGC